MEALKLILFSLAVIGFFSWYSNYIPQIESHPPKKISLTAGLGGDEMIEAGERVFDTKGTCNICHAIGRPGNRGPDLAGVAIAAAKRKAGFSATDYLLESLLKPTAYLVEGYGALMPPMGSILTPGEIMVTVAYLQSLGGEVTIGPDEVRRALAEMTAAAAQAKPAQAADATSGSPGGSAKGGGAAGDRARGEEVYKKNCAPCHGPDPAVDGPVGPRIGGASAALVEARVLRAGYPPGYQPLRDTRLMPPMPQLEGELAHLSAFLAR